MEAIIKLTRKYTNVKWRYCDKVGHFEIVCLKKKLENSGKLHYVEEDECGKNCENSGSYLFNFSSYCRDVNKISIDPIVVTPKISGSDIPMEVDTGSAVSIISQATLDKYLKTYTLEDTDTRLKTYSGEQIRPIGKNTGQGRLEWTECKFGLTCGKTGGTNPHGEKLDEISKTGLEGN